MQGHARSRAIVTISCLMLLAVEASGIAAGGSRPTQQAVADGELSLAELREAGLRMFAGRFTKEVGYGDGPIDVADTVSPGGRPSLQGNGMLLRVNGLDGQSCVECHSVVRADTVPPVFGVGGAGGSVTNAMIMPTEIDPADLSDLDGHAGFNGRFANPPFLFGVGAVELLALEMSRDLRDLAAEAVAHPGTPVELVTKGVSFGRIVADGFGDLDFSDVEGVDDDLVVKPFGRKGEFATAREFDVEALQFHFGMQPVEVVGPGIDADGDGVYDEVLIGEVSALNVFVASTEPPRMDRLERDARRGFTTFDEIGCASCHVPTLSTERVTLPLRYPEVRTDPDANVYLELDLTRPQIGFDRNRTGGIDVPLFSDLKRHDMGPDLAETFSLADEKRNREFTTGKLWGIADSAPYLHDGRASTLREAILLHGGEAQDVRDGFAALPERDVRDLLAFLRSLRTPDPSMPRGRPRNDPDERRSDPEITDLPDGEPLVTTEVSPR